MILSFGQICLGKQCRPRSIWSGSTLFAILSASFGLITLWKSHIDQILEWLQQMFWVSEYLGNLWYTEFLPSALLGNDENWRRHSVKLGKFNRGDWQKSQLKTVTLKFEKLNSKEVRSYCGHTVFKTLSKVNIFLQIILLLVHECFFTWNLHQSCQNKD